MDKPKLYFIIVIFSILFVISGLVKTVRSLPLFSLYHNIKLGGMNIESDNVRVKIEGVMSFSPAEDAQLKVGDIIVNANNIDINKTNDFIDIVYKNRGKFVDIVLERNGEIKQIQLSPKLESLPGGGYAGVSISDSKLQFQKEPIYILIPKTLLQDISWNIFTIPNSEIVVGPIGIAAGVSLQKEYFRPFIFLLGMIQIILAIGLIKLKKWALYGMFILVFINLAQIIVYFSFAPSFGASLAMSVVGFSVLILFIYYIYTQRKLFI
jgi:membrane-associated protease RseP (regulator of RpoE activity)